MPTRPARQFFSKFLARRGQRRFAALVLAVIAAAPMVRADQDWDGDNGVGNFSFNNNWYGDNQPTWGFSNGNLNFNYNNATQSSLYYDYGLYQNTNDIFFKSTYPSSIVWNGDGTGINFNQRLENDSTGTFTLGTMNLSGAKNGASQIELNPVGGNMVINGNIYNDNSLGYHVYGANGKTLTLNSALGVGSNASNVSFTLEQNSNVITTADQTWTGATTIKAGTLSIGNAGTTGSLASGSAISISSGAQLIFNRSNALSISNVISGAGTLTQSGAGTTTLTGANPAFTGATSINAGILTLGTGGSLGSTGTRSGAVSVAGGAALIIDGGTLTGTSLGLFNNLSAANGSLINNGTLNLSGNLAVAASDKTQGSLFTATSGTITANSVTVGRTGLNNMATIPTGGSISDGLRVNGATVNITTTLGIGTSSNSNSSANFRIDSGSVTVGGTTTITENGQTRYSVLDVHGGTFTSNDTAGAGILVGGNFATSYGELLVAGGVLNANKITLGNASQTNGSDVFHLLGGTAYIGGGGIVTGTATPAYSTQVNLIGGTLAASAIWSTSLATTLLADSTIKAADASGNAFNITLNGALTNSGADRTLTLSGGGTTTLGSGLNLSEAQATGRLLTVTGPGNLNLSSAVADSAAGVTTGIAKGLTFNSSFTGAATISNANTYTGTTTLSAGTFVLGNKAAFGTSTVALNGGSISANTDLSGANAINNATSGTSSGSITTFTGTNNIELAGVMTDSVSRTLTNNLSGGTLKLSNTINLSNSVTNYTLTVNGTGNATISGAILNGGTSTASNLTYAGSGILTLSGANTYGGTTSVSSGTVILTGSLAGSSVSTSSTGVFTESSAGVISGAGTFTQNSSGVSILANANTYTGTTTISAGALRLDNSLAVQNSTVSNAVTNGLVFGTGITTATLGGLSGVGNIALTNSGSGAVALGVGNNNATTTYSGVLSGIGALTKIGTGQINLQGVNTYAGPTTINNGTLNLDFANSAASGQILYSGVTLSPTTGVLVMNGSTLTESNATNTTKGQIFGATNIASGASILTQAGRTSSAHPYINLAGITRTVGATVDITSQVGSGNTLTDGTTGYFTTTANSASGILAGWATAYGGTDWARNTGSAGNNGGSHIYGYGQSGATYVNTAITTATSNLDMTASVTLNSNVTFGSVRFNNATSGIALGLTGTNVNATGGILVTPVVGANATTISGGTGLTTSAADLVINQFNTNASGALTINSAVINNGGTSIALTKSGGGTAILGGTNTYTGVTTVNAGALLVNGNQAAATGSVSVGSGGTLGGTGTLGGATSVASGGSITGGANGTIGTLTITKPLTINGTYVADVSTTTSDTLALTGTTTAGVLTLGGTSVLNIVTSGTLTAAHYVLATYASLSGTFGSVTIPNNYVLTYGTTALTLDVPEPSTWLGGFFLLGAVAYSQRRRFAKSAAFSKSF